MYFVNRKEQKYMRGDNMDTGYELRTKICEKTGDEVVSAVMKTDNGETEHCLCSHLCKTPCSIPPKTLFPETF